MNGIATLMILVYTAVGLYAFESGAKSQDRSKISDSCAGEAGLGFSKTDAEAEAKIAASPHLSKLQKDLYSLVRELKSRGATHLLEGYESRDVVVKLANGPAFPGGAAIFVAGSAKSNHVVINKLDLSTPALRERALWKLAEAFYRAEMRRSFRTSMAHSNPANSARRSTFPKAEPGFLPLQKGVEFFRTNRLARIDELQTDLYRLLESLKHNDPKTLIPAADPAGTMWIRLTRLLADPGRYISVNLSDLEAYVQVGPKAVVERVAKRHRAMLYRVYLVQRLKLWTKNLMAAGIVIIGLNIALIGAAGEPPPATPAQIHAMEARVDQGVATPEEIARLYIQLSKQLNGLEHVVIKPDLNAIAQLRAVIQKLKTDHPELENVRVYP